MENNIRIDVEEVECEDVEWLKMAQHGIMNTVTEENHLIVASGFDARTSCREQRRSSHSLSCSSCEGSWWSMAAGWKVC